MLISHGSVLITPLAPGSSVGSDKAANLLPIALNIFMGIANGGVVSGA
jgi:hypothetical protein